MSGIILLSAMSSEEKVECMYDIFDFNMKGYLVDSEVVLMLHTLTKCAAKIDSKMAAPHMDKIREIAVFSMDYCLLHEHALRKYELVTFAADFPPTRACSLLLCTLLLLRPPSGLALDFRRKSLSLGGDAILFPRGVK
jgi:hypothetical protein